MLVETSKLHHRSLLLSGLHLLILHLLILLDGARRSATLYQHHLRPCTTVLRSSGRSPSLLGKIAGQVKEMKGFSMSRVLAKDKEN